MPKELDHPRYREYPEALWEGEIRFNLLRETRFCRTYSSPDKKRATTISRFMDGSASISAQELKKEWPNWPYPMRSVFCTNCGWLHKQEDYAEIMWHILNDADPDLISASSSKIATCLKQESYPVLLTYLHQSLPGDGSNLVQALMETGHPAAEPTIRRRLALLWEKSLFVGNRRMDKLDSIRGYVLR